MVWEAGVSGEDTVSNCSRRDTAWMLVGSSLQRVTPLAIELWIRRGGP